MLTDPDPGAITVCMYCPSARGGHAWYTRNLLEAVSHAQTAEMLQPFLVSSTDLSPEFRSDRYAIYAVLPALKDKSQFPTQIQWAASRIVHYVRRDRMFLRWIRRRNRPGIVHMQEQWDWTAARQFRLLQRAGNRVYCTVHNLSPHNRLSPILEAARAFCMRRALRRCNGLFVHSAYLASQLSGRLGPGHPPIVITPHGVTPSTVSPAERRDLATSQGCELLFFGTLRPNKGVTVLLTAMEQVPSCRLTIAGMPTDPVYRQRVLRGIGRLREGTVRLIDAYIPDEHVQSLFEESHLIILPYTSFDAQSGVLSRAISYLVPVVVSDIGALGETVRNFGLGEVVTPNDADALAAGIRRMLAPNRQAQAIEGLSAARTQLTWDEMARVTVRAYLSSGTWSAEAKPAAVDR